MDRLVRDVQSGIMRLFLGWAFLAAFASLQAAELRTWTSRQGSTIEAQVARVEKDSVILLTNEPKELPIKIADLSLADRQHLVEYSGQPKEILKLEIGTPEKDVRIDKKQFKRLDKELVFDADSELVFELFESDHFLVATAGKARPNAVAETAERLWYGMAFQHMNFRKDWGDKKLVIFLIEDEDIYNAMGQWYRKFLRANNNVDYANELELIWDRLGGAGINLPADVRENYNVFDQARLLRIRANDSRAYRKVFGPFPTHTISSTLLSKQMGGISTISPNGYFAILTGHSYFKEIQLAGESQTSLLSVDDYQDDEIAQTRGFEDGTSWAKTLRKLVKRGDLKLDFNQMLSWESATLSPENLVVIYSFSYYMNSSPSRIASLAEMVRRIETNNQIPAAVEIAALFGFKSVEEMESDWTEFVSSGDFK